MDETLPGDEWGRALLESMALYLLNLGVGDNEEKGFEMCRTGDVVHLRVRDASGEIVFQVVGSDLDELGAQLALACLHNVSIEQLGALHLQPLNKPLQLQKKKKTE